MVLATIAVVAYDEVVAFDFLCAEILAMVRPAPPLSVPDARKLMRDVGIRGTSCRIAVLQFLATKSSPITHADVAEALVPEGFDKSTVYRCLIELADAGLLGRFDVGDHVWRFEFKRGETDEAEYHPHFMCVDCGKVTCLPEVDISIQGMKAKKTSGVGDVTEVLLKGHCTECK
jgi:Fur family ferric uptake transcriptional regulator